ncbi:MAG: metallophosphoesterase [Flavitalea sp.]
MRNPSFLWIIIAIMALLDIYVFQALKMVLPTVGSKLRLIIIVIYWFIALVTIGTLIAFPYINFESLPKSVRTYIFALLVAAFFSKLIASLFFAIDDIRRGATWVIVKLFRTSGAGEDGAVEGITRSAFLSWLGLIMGGSLLSTLIYGFSNKYNYHLKHVNLSYKNLPSSFKGLKIIQISDIHSGSFNNLKAVQKGVDMILNEKPDLVLFTGDLVNDKATEMVDYMDIFKKVTAPMGVYSTLGNHDYGDYSSWKTEEDKRANLERLKEVHGELGWKLLMNENVAFKKNNEQIALIGVENWSAKRNFPKHGRLDLAYAGTEGIPFKILMSHDPSHWDAEIRPKYSDIDLTLSGHTHGMQFGIEIPGFKWSPIQYMYNQWAGLYEENNQKLYVNRGYGFIGYPGRVGILPEITVITLT